MDRRGSNPPRDEELEPMVTIDCPFCDGPLPVEDAEPLRCDACSVELAFAADPAPPTEVALAA